MTPIKLTLYSYITQLDLEYRVKNIRALRTHDYDMEEVDGTLHQVGKKEIASVNIITPVASRSARQSIYVFLKNPKEDNGVDMMARECGVDPEYLDMWFVTALREVLAELIEDAFPHERLKELRRKGVVDQRPLKVLKKQEE